MSEQKKIYFTAGPAKIPQDVMKQVHDELLDYDGLNISVMEMSHRSADFVAIRDKAEANLRKLLKVPDNYTVLFMHGGAKTQFDSVPMNLCSELDKCKLDYIINGSWSKMAADDAKKYAKVHEQVLKSDKFDRIPSSEELEEVNDATFRYYCDNETIQGLEFNYVPASDSKVPLVCDMTSNFLSRPVDVSKFGVIFAGCQKNCGMSGLAIVIVRDDLIGREMRITPKIQNYQIAKTNKSLYNTPPTMAIYVAGLCFEWMLAHGGLDAMDKNSKEKSGLIYATVDESDGFYICPVPKNSRSRMNVVFILANKELDSKFLEESKAAGLFELKGHRSVGGFRASLYHGITLEDVRRLSNFMTEFRLRYKK